MSEIRMRKMRIQTYRMVLTLDPLKVSEMRKNEMRMSVMKMS